MCESHVDTAAESKEQSAAQDGCSCCAGAATEPAAGERPAGANTTTYKVAGMTCGHCVTSVTAEIRKLPGVEDVRVDLQTATVSVSAHQPIAEAALASAVTEAGYEFAGIA